MARTAATVAGQLFCGAAIFADHEVRCQTRSPVDECGAAHRSRVTLPHRPSAFTGESDRKKPGGELQSSAGNNNRRRKRIGEVLGYFRRHRQRMDYAPAAEHHLPIGSGVVEAACKTLATQRLKRSGMRWRHAGGQAILTLRGLVQSKRFEQGWHRLSETYRTEVALPHNVVALPRKRAA